MIRSLVLTLSMIAASSAVAQTGEVVPAEEIITRQTFGLATDLCLQHVLSPATAPGSFRAAGFELTEADEGTLTFNTNGVTGFLAPRLTREWCWISSDRLSLDLVQTIGLQRAQLRYPSGVSGPAATGTLANSCASLTVLIGQRVSTLEFRNAQFSTGCDSPETGGILFQ